MSKNESLQVFVKIDLKCSIYGPEDKTRKITDRKIEVIVHLWELVEVGKIGVF
jgi:hypothetical protein